MSDRLMDKVIIIIRSSNYKDYGCGQGYLVEVNNKKQLENALKWGTETATDEFSGHTTSVEPIEVLTDNKGFKLTFIESANQSSQGGKLSFWNCLIEKEPDVKAIIGIDQESILSLIKQSTVINGTIQEGLSLYKKGTCSAVHPGMHEWNELMNKTSAEHGPKTSKWEVGKNYKSKTLNELVLCKMYKRFKIEEKVEGVNFNRHYSYYVTFNTKPEQVTVTSSVSSARELHNKIKDGSIKSISEVMRYICHNIESQDKSWGILDASEFLAYYGGIIGNRYPSREVGDIALINDDYTEELDNMLNKLREQIMKVSKERMGVKDFMSCFGYTATKDKDIKFSDYEKEVILDSMWHTVYIDFGDGVFHTGRVRT